MRNTQPLEHFDEFLTAYLATRRALGRASRMDEYVLRRLRAYLARTGRVDLDAEGFARWRRRLRHCAHNTQIDWAMMVFRFCRYRRRREHGCFLPQRWQFGRKRAYTLPVPIQPDQVRQLLDYCARQPQRDDRPLVHAARRLAIVLLYTAGLRRGEAAHLRVEDVDAKAGVLRITGSKFHKSRWVPLSRSATRELRAYLRLRAALVPRSAHNPMLLCYRRTRGYTAGGLSNAVRDVMRQSGLWAAAPRIPHVHDFRHAFAVAALRQWYEQGLDVQAEMPKLTMYMGHVSIASTAYYLRYMPAVVNLAGERFAGACAGIVEGGAT